MDFDEKRGPQIGAGGLSARGSSTRRARRAGVTIVCGHWSTLELKLCPNVLMLDSGCLWGGTLTAVRLDDRRVYQVPGACAVAAKAVRIASSAARASSRRCRARAGSAGTRCSSATSARSPVTFQNDVAKLVSPTYAGATLVRPALSR